MRYFHVVLIGLLALIAVELGVVAIKLPTPAAQAQTQPPRYAPAPALQDPHDVIKAQLTQVQRELAGNNQRLATIERQLASMGQNEDKLLFYESNDYKRLFVTCWMISQSRAGNTTPAAGPCTYGFWTRPAQFNNFEVPFGP